MESSASYTQKVARYSRNRPVILILTILIVGVCVGYVWFTMHTARELRMWYGTNRNAVTAHLAARLLNERWNSVTLALKALSDSSALQNAVRSPNRSRLRKRLRDAMDDLFPALVFAAVYGPDGKLITNYPVTPTPPEDVSRKPWFRNITATQTLYKSDIKPQLGGQQADALALAMPLGHKEWPLGYLVVYYRLGNMNEWLRQLHMNDSALYVVNAQGNVIDASSSSGNRLISFAGHPALRLALQGQEGARVFANDDTPGGGIVGYAFADRPGWVVLVVQPLAQALIATNYLARRLALLTAVILILLVGTLWGISVLYRRQSELSVLLVEQNRRLRSADRAKSDFLANVSHNLQTPLANLQLSISGLLEPHIAWKPEQVQECLYLASEELDQLTARVRNLLTMTRIEAHAWPLQKELCDLTDVVGAALERVASLRRERPIQTDFPLEPLLLECDPVQIETVLVNLLENAIKYSPPDTALYLRGEKSRASVYCSVRDKGPGVHSADAERIFEKFYRAPSIHRTGGTGLGLAICKAIIEAHEGAIGVRNVIGGAEFWFLLPLQGPTQ